MGARMMISNSSAPTLSAWVAPGLSGQVQCLDGFSGCIDALDRMQLMQSTGFLADFYFLAPENKPVVTAMREQFWQELQQNPPRVFVETSQVFPESEAKPDRFDKVKNWPRFDDYLNSHYHLVAERKFTRAMRWGGRDFYPQSYRIYLRNGAPGGSLALALATPER